MTAHPKPAEIVSLMLTFGYVPMRGEWADGLLKAIEPPPQNKVRRLPKDALRVLEASIDLLLDSHPGPHIVPISGGLDSRLILGLLRRRLTSSEIVAATVGTPGTWDFEIGRRVATTCSVPHHAIDLRGMKWDAESLSEHVGGRIERAGDLFEARLFHKLYRLGSGTYWIGLLGDNLAGSHVGWQQLAANSSTWEGAKSAFFRAQCRDRHSRSDLCLQASWNTRSGSARIARSIHPLDEVDIAYRQQHLYAVLRGSHPWAMPYADSCFASLFLNLPQKDRLGRKFFIQMLVEAVPELARIPGKDYALGLFTHRSLNGTSRSTRRMQSRLHRLSTTVGVRNVQAPPRTNYVDWGREHATNKSLRDAVEDLASSALERWSPQIRSQVPKVATSGDLRLLRRLAALGTLMPEERD